jgi:hypothetical protein
LPAFDQISSTVAAMRRFGLANLASLLDEALQLFGGYIEPASPTTWDAILGQHDPGNRLVTLGMKINALEDYGLSNSQIR